MEKDCSIFYVEKLYFIKLWTSLGLGLHILKFFWIVVGIGLSFKKSGLHGSVS